MNSKVAIFVALFALAYAKPKPGQEAPPPKVHTYNVPSVAKVAYPGPQVTKSVETYSAPSIEKTTTITRTITAPLNAPNVQSVQYSAPAAPVVAAPAAVAAPIAFGGPGIGGGFGYGAPGYGGFAGYAAGPAFAGYAAGPAYGAVKGYSVPTLSLGGPAVGPSLAAYAPGAGGHGIGYATLYSAPSLGYNLGAPAYAAGPALAVAPVKAAYGAPGKY